MKRYFLFTLLFTLVSAISGQEISKHAISLKSHYGFIAPHRKGMTNLITGHIPFIEIDLETPTDGKKYWHKNFDNPITGVGFFFGSLGNKEHLGSFTAVSPYIGFPLINRKIKMYLRFSSGIGYVSKPFDLKNNYQNDLIGSNINVFFNFLNEVSISISSKLDWKTGLSFSHLSNGAFALPNLGINIPAAFIGLTYNFDRQKKRQLHIPHSDSSTVSLVTDFSFGVREYEIDGAKKLGLNWSLTGWKKISNSSCIGIGNDLFYNRALIEHFRRETNTPATAINILRHGVAIGYKLNVSRVNLYFLFGTYTYAKENTQAPVYQKLGGYIWLNKKLYINCNLKVHFAVADFFHFGIGYKLWNK